MLGPKRLPSAIQEGFKRLSAGIMRLRCNLKPFDIDFRLQKGTPGPQKSMNYIEKTILFDEFAF